MFSKESQSAEAPLPVLDDQLLADMNGGSSTDSQQNDSVYTSY